MSKYYTLLFIWSKGAKVRKEVICIIDKASKDGNPIYISEITNKFNDKKNEKDQITNSSIRKHIKVLKEYKIVQPINEGGRPEFLELTNEGKEIIEKLKSSKQ